MRNWEEFEKFEPVIDKYMPGRGEGGTIASQICTAVNKLVYKWFNDGDVYDNTCRMEGWCNDLSSYANWLWMIVPESKDILEEICHIKDDGEYTDMLYELCDKMIDPEFLAGHEVEKVGSVYKCDGPFQFREYDDEWDDGYDEYDDEEDC